MRDLKYEGYLERLPDFITDDYEKACEEESRREKRYKDFCKESIKAMERRDAGQDNDWWETYRNLDPSYDDWKKGVKFEPKELTEEEKIESQKKWEEEWEKECEEIRRKNKEHDERFKVLDISMEKWDSMSEDLKNHVVKIEFSSRKAIVDAWKKEIKKYPEIKNSFQEYLKNLGWDD